MPGLSGSLLRKLAILGITGVAAQCANLVFPGSLEAAEIRLRERATVTDELIRVGDIAEIRDVPEAEQQALEEVLLGPAPVVGQSRNIGFEDVRSRLVATGQSLGNLNFKGASRTVVLRKESSPTPSAATGVRQVSHSLSERATHAAAERERTRIGTVLQTAFEQQFKPRPGKIPPVVTIRAPKEIPAELSQAGPEQIEFIIDQLPHGAGQPLAGQVRSSQPGIPATLFTAEITITEPVMVLSVARPVVKGEILQQADLKWIPMAGAGKGLTNAADAIGKEVRKTYRPGDLLAAEDLVASPLIRQSDIVTAKIKTGGITVKRQCKSAGTGTLGETIVLISLDDPRDRMTAIVTGYHEAEIITSSSPTGVQFVSGNERSPAGGRP